jgi:hypothetical protein
MGELPEGGVVFPEDLVLAVILNQVFPKTNITVRDKKVQRDEIVFKKFKLRHHQVVSNILSLETYSMR